MVAGQSGEASNMFAEALSQEALEISILSSEGLPAGSVVSLRAGSMRRQRPLSQCTEPFVFCANDGRNAFPLQVDILQPVATTGQQFSVGAGEHKLVLGSDDGKTPMDAMSITLSVSGNSANQAPSVNSSDNLQRYVEKHDLMRKVTSAMKKLFRQLPDDPMKFLAEELLPTLTQDRASTAKIATAECPIASGESLHLLPACVKMGATTARLIDFGSGETGFYTYWMDKQQQLNRKEAKRKAAFLNQYVEPRNVDGFCDAIIEEFELTADPSSSSYVGDLAIFCGATGLNRDVLLSSQTTVQAATDFLRDAEQTLAKRLQIAAVRLRLFVPSGLVEAQLELRATEWLVGRTNLFDNDGDDVMGMRLLKEAGKKLGRDTCGLLSEDEVLSNLTTNQASRKSVTGALPRVVTEMNAETMDPAKYASALAALRESRTLQSTVQQAAFAGTVSAGGGSCQMSMNGGADSALQLFSIPVGNRVPIVEGMFSKPVLDEEREHWRQRIRSELTHAAVPRKARGFFVGISAAFHAMKAAKMADRLITKQQALDALEATLKELPADDQRSIANLTLVYELLNWVFDDEAYFLFRRIWKFDDREYTSTWTLGLYTQQVQTSGISKASGEDKWRIARSRIKPPISMQHMLEDGRGYDALLEVPFIAWPLHPSCLLDFGSGEMGFYKFEADLTTLKVKTMLSKKVGKPIYDYYVKDSLVEEFADTMIKEFGIAEPARFGACEVMAGGATGLHREMLLKDPEKREAIQKFLSEVERVVESKIDRKMTMRLFVPSGELEAQFELRAVVWLIGQPDVDVGSGWLADFLIDDAFRQLTAANLNSPPGTREGIRAEKATQALSNLGMAMSEIRQSVQKADVDSGGTIDRDEFFGAVREDPLLQALVRRTSFCGTISAGGGSSQLSLCTSSSGTGTTQLYSMPIGNRVPQTTGMFSEAVTADEQAMWVERIRAALHHEGFPQGLTGLFVGISAFFYAAKTAGVEDRIVEKHEVVVALANSLANAKETDHKTIANLILTKELISWAFDDDKSCFLFKRNWTANGSTHVAGWTLGWYVTQFEGDAGVRDRCVVKMQSIFRGKKTRRNMQLILDARPWVQKSADA